jgi:hypothetical protein
VDAWRKEAVEVRDQWVKAATTPAERELRSRVLVTTTTRENYARATENLLKKERPGGGRAGLVIGAAIAAYVFFDTGSAYAAAQSVNPAASTTDILTSGNITLRGVIAAGVKDALLLTPPGIAVVGSYEGIEAGAELLKMQVDCSAIGLAYEMGDISADNRDLNYCMPLLAPKIQQDVNRELFSGF